MHPFPLVRDWRVEPSPDRSYLDVVDATGHSRARVVGLCPHRLTPRGRQTLQVLLPDGSATTLANGTRWWGGRRARTRGILPLGGSTYVFQHRSSRRARVLRDGAWIATAVREVRGPSIEVRSVLTPDDELACALFGHVLRPGAGQRARRAGRGAGVGAVTADRSPVDPFTPLAGWRLVPPSDGGRVDVVDPTGRVWARVVGIVTQADLQGRQVLDVLLPDGRETTLTNGTSVWGPRRTRTRGLLPLGPVSYVLEHRTGRRAHLLRDGTLVARLRREPESHEDLQRRHVPGRTIAPLVELTGPLGHDDQLALAVTGLVLRPGRWTHVFRVVDRFWGVG